MDNYNLLWLLCILMTANVIAAITLLVQEHRRRYAPKKWVYEPGDYPYDWEYQKFVDLVNEQEAA
jgi:hypothetical protein